MNDNIPDLSTQREDYQEYFASSRVLKLCAKLDTLLAQAENKPDDTVIRGDDNERY